VTDTLENADVKSTLVEADSSQEPPQIQLCDGHDEELRNALLARHSLNDRVYLKAFHGLCTLAAQAMGTDMLVQYKCPVCAFKDVPFVDLMADAASDILNKPKIYLPS
jgi:hypothetical protein